MQNQKILIVCIANYCRSPVAEAILKNNFGNQYIFDSAGICPLESASMDPRSKEFLNGLGIKNTFHNPKKITLNMFQEARKVFALDVNVLTELNQRFGINSKTKLLGFKETTTKLSDPYKMNQSDYDLIMNNINTVCTNFSLIDFDD